MSREAASGPAAAWALPLSGGWLPRSARGQGGVHARAELLLPSEGCARDRRPRRAALTALATLARRRKRNGGHKVEWDDDRGLNRDGMNLPAQCIYIGCIDMEVTDEAEQEAIEALLLETYRWREEEGS